MSSLRTAAVNVMRPAFRPAVTRHLARRNFVVGYQPGIEAQHLTQEASTAMELVFSYFGLMGVSCAVGGIAGGYVANKENNENREALREQYAQDIRDEMIRNSLV